MSAPDRPTREQLDVVPHKAAALLLSAARPDPTLRTAARQVQDALIALDDEVHALRAAISEALNRLDRLAEPQEMSEWNRSDGGVSAEFRARRKYAADAAAALRAGGGA